MKPLVSVICLCYNHEKFVAEALHSVISQTYKEIEIIVVDDFSTDKSMDLIRKIIKDNPQIKLIENKSNLGNCKSFNKAFGISNGAYVIDFATDDVMYPDRIKRQVEAFEKLEDHFGVMFTNAMNIDEQGREINIHFKENDIVPAGDVYIDILERYFISPPTMVFRKDVLLELGGYDESLAYEDFDFWVRSSRKYKYHYLNEVLTKRRISSLSHSSKFYTKGNVKMGETTFRVVQKAIWLNRNMEENAALIKRINFELRQSYFVGNYELAGKYFNLLKELQGRNILSRMILLLSKLKIPVLPFYKLYLKIRK